MAFSVASARSTLLELKDAQRRQWRCEAERFQLVADWADEYRWVPEDDGVALPGTERLVQWGGEGTPSIAEFCSLELAAGLGLTETSARLLLRDALAIRGRFPSVWLAVADLSLRVWQAREVARLTLDLTFAQCQELDDELAHLVGTMSWTRLDELIRARVLELRGAAAQDDRARALARRRVDLDPSHLGVTDVSATLDAADAIFLDAQLNRLAGILADAGNTQPHQVRRAQALGVLASPARALQLLQASLTDELPEDLDPGCPAVGQRGHTCGTVDVDPEALLPRTELVVHLTDECLATQQGLSRVERVGPVLTGWLVDLLGHTRVHVRPVLNPEQLVASDAYECPPRMREWVHLRNRTEVFPHSRRSSRGLDLDHTRPYRPGAGGQTHPDNLGPLTRKVHRAKTHGGWQVEQLEPGVFAWTSPLGFPYLVTPTGTQAIAA